MQFVLGPTFERAGNRGSARLPYSTGCIPPGRREADELSPPVACVGDSRHISEVLKSLDLSRHMRGFHFKFCGQLARSERLQLLKPTKDDGGRSVHGNPRGTSNPLVPPNTIDQIGDLAESLLYSYQIG